MKYIKSGEIRKKFFNFFVENGHTKVASSSLIPAQDPTLLFANAGMNQFKDIFLGNETRSYDRAVTIQKCMRAGGKHNDLDNVGFTARHCTFFEMMGNFSFGSYFKKEAIQYAWDFLTKELYLPEDKLYPSVYEKDDEAFEIWKNQIGISENRIIRLGAQDNFWQMGDTGPCGPCSEIYIDRGLKYGCKSPTCAPGCSCDRFLEIWNLVFMQFNRQSDGKDLPLERFGVDTGMGLERICSVIQEVDSVFDTDLFESIIKTIEKETGHKYDENKEIQAAFRVLADHIRSISFVISDGGTPSNEGRGYVLRKIIRRALLFAQKLSDKNFLPKLISPLVEKMSEFYPDLLTNQNIIKKLLEEEIDRFQANLISGKSVFEKYCAEIKSKNKKQIEGAQAFKLYDTYGFPLELTRILAQENNLTVDVEGFEKEMELQKSRSGKKDSSKKQKLPDTDIVTDFVGYNQLKTTATIKEIWIDSVKINQVSSNENCFIITDKSPFYAESGGQVSDIGDFIIKEIETPINNIYKIKQAIAIEIKTPTEISVGDEITLVVEKKSRLATMRNHSATHLLQAVLVKLLGKHIKQSGSLVTADYLRFDFSYTENMTTEIVKNIEDLVNEKILENLQIKISETTYDDAVKKGATAIFGEKYNPEKVRVVDIENFSMELCGGTHVNSTGDIGCFKIVEVSSPSVGNKRIVAVTGLKAVELFQETFNLVKNLSQEFKVKPEKIFEAIKKQQELLKDTTLQVKNLKHKIWQLNKPEWLEKIETIGSIPFLYLSLKDLSQEDLKDIASDLAETKDGFYFLTTEIENVVHFYIAVSPKILKEINLQKIMLWLREHKFKGGGTTTLQGSVPSFDEKILNEFKNLLIQNQN